MATILVVDDEPGVRALIRDSLELEDHSLTQLRGKPATRQLSGWGAGADVFLRKTIAPGALLDCRDYVVAGDVELEPKL